MCKICLKSPCKNHVDLSIKRYSIHNLISVDLKPREEKHTGMSRKVQRGCLMFLSSPFNLPCLEPNNFDGWCTQRGIDS